METARAEPAGAWRFERRGTPWFGHAIAGGGGALTAIGVIAIGIDLYPDDGDGAGWVGALLCAGLVVVSLLLLRALPDVARPACVAASAIGIAGAVAFVVFPGTDRFEDLRPFFAVVIAAWAIAFVVGPAKGRTLLLGLALLLAFSWAMAEVADVTPTDVVPTPIVPNFGSSGSGTIDDFTTGDDFSDDTGDVFDDSFASVDDNEPNWGQLGVVATGFALVYLVGVAVLDARGRRGLATAMVLPGVIALVTAIEMFSAEANNVVVTGLVSLAAGLFCGSVGAQSHRRFMVWTGAFLATVGAIVLSFKVTDSTVGGDDPSDNAATIFGAITIAFGVVMVAVGALVGRLLREPPRGDDPPDANEPASLFPPDDGKRDAGSASVS
jgi:hypothetical protein